MLWIYNIFYEGGKNITNDDFKNVNKLITDKFPNCLRIKNDSPGFINAGYTINEEAMNVFYGREGSEIWILTSDKDEKTKKEIESKTKLEFVLRAHR